MRKQYFISLGDNREMYKHGDRNLPHNDRAQATAVPEKSIKLISKVKNKHPIHFLFQEWTNSSYSSVEAVCRNSLQKKTSYS